MKITKDGMMVNRVGSPNAQKQFHREFNPAPVTRGIWAFPWPLNDYYFSIHQLETHMPKNADYEIIGDKYYEIRKEKFQQFMKTKAFFWNKPFYSHLKPDVNMSNARWYLWDDFVAFKKMVYKKRYYSYENNLKYSIDHLEIFLPMKNHNLPLVVGVF